ncbi:hypothetical protein RRL34_004266 [Vibrio parahaemolyticus]|nr:hypothetical protein [Vibrio parahaemolyticus]
MSDRPTMITTWGAYMTRHARISDEIQQGYDVEANLRYWAEKYGESNTDAYTAQWIKDFKKNG